MAVAVNIFAQDDSLAHSPIEGVAVAIYGTDGALAASVLTDVNGRAALLLPGSSVGTVYEVRAFKLGTIFANPMGISVVEDGDPAVLNDFDLVGTLTTFPVATDPRTCRCTGRFMDLSNRPISGASVRLMAQAEAGFQVPKIVDGNLVAAESVELKTDSNGYISIDLLRGGQYLITYSGETDTAWNLKVPNRSSANLIDLIFPRPVELTWDPTIAVGNSVVVHVDEQVIVPFSVLFSDYEVRSTDLSKWVDMVQVVGADGAVVDLAFLESTAAAVLKGLRVGSSTVHVSIRPNLYPCRIPDYSLTASDLAITVL